MNRTTLLPALCLLLACSEDTSSPSPSGASTTSANASIEPPGCERSTALEADFSTGAGLDEWQGPGADPVTKKLLEPDADGYVVATTRLNMRPEGSQLFSKHVGAIFGEIQKQPGFVAFQTGFSDKCGIARTLSVWKDEESLYTFVASGAHKAAMNETSKMSRGLSNTTHFKVSKAADASWSAAARAIGEDDGPFY